MRGASPSFNGGPGNCPAKLPLPRTWNVVSVRLQWRAGQLPGQTRKRSKSSPRMRSRLQWRAGQLPGQTRTVRACRLVLELASMEGRAIARPNLAVLHATRLAVKASMEGRAIARPNQGRLRTAARTSLASMEGRAIARPNHDELPWRSTASLWLSFNGGPGNCPAKRCPICTLLRTRHRSASMEGPGNCPAKHPQPSIESGFRSAGASMEGRAIARPNGVVWWWRVVERPRFNGGPGNCPAKPPALACISSASLKLQWRAGQLPGQTGSW